VPFSFQDKNSALQKLRNDFASLPLGRAMLDWADKNGVEIRITKKGLLKGYRGTYHKGKILIKPGQSHLQMIAILAHELRHTWQDLDLIRNTPKYDFNLTANPIAGLIHTRFQEADAYSFQAMFMRQYVVQNFEVSVALKKLDTVIYQDMPFIKLDKKDIVFMSDRDLRKAVFEEFTVRNHKLRNEYDDLYVLSHYKDAFKKKGSLAARSMEVLDKTSAKLMGKDREDVFLSEDILTKFGTSAWGECNENNYIQEQDGLAYTYTPLHMMLSHKNMQILSNMLALSFYQNMNGIKVKSGKVVPIFHP
jgi:hypothetical protein